MKARLLAALAAGLMVGAADPAPDLGEVQSQVIPPGSRWLLVNDYGLWEMWQFRKDGSLVTVEEYCVDRMRCTIDRMATPPRLDLPANYGMTRMGIYRVEGDRLLICYGYKKRPTTFAHRPKADQYLIILKRVK